MKLYKVPYHKIKVGIDLGCYHPNCLGISVKKQAFFRFPENK